MKLKFKCNVYAIQDYTFDVSEEQLEKIMDAAGTDLDEMLDYDFFDIMEVMTWAEIITRKKPKMTKKKIEEFDAYKIDIEY